MTHIPVVVTDNTVGMLVGDSMRTITESHINYADIRAAIADGRYEDAQAMMDVSKQITDYADGKVEIKAGIVYCNGQAVDNSLTRRILGMKDEGFNIDPMVNFLKNLMENPSFRAVKELYGFLEATTLPITADGHFMGYKMVRSDFTDIFSGKFDNSPGEVPEVPRNMVDEDPNNTCSNGLHVCSEAYLGKYGSYDRNDIVVLVKVNPRDVVAVPTDYNNAKMRVCRYEVIRQAKIAKAMVDSQPEYTTSVVDSAGNETDDDAPFQSVREERDGTVTALFPHTEAADRLCPGAMNKMGALRKRLSRGTATEEYGMGPNGGSMVRCPLTADEVDEWSEYLDADSEEEYDVEFDDTIDGDFYNDYT